MTGLAGLAMRMHDAGDCTFIGWASMRDSSSIKGRWLELPAVGLAARENVAYAVTYLASADVIAV